jgi:hypothetical protein
LFQEIVLEAFTIKFLRLFIVDFLLNIVVILFCVLLNVIVKQTTKELRIILLLLIFVNILLWFVELLDRCKHILLHIFVHLLLEKFTLLPQLGDFWVLVRSAECDR